MSVRQHRAARIAAATKELACWTTCVKMETKEFATITDPAAEERSYQELRLLARQFKSLRQPAEEECKVLGQLLNSLSWNERRRNNLQAACGNAAEAAHVFTSLIRSAAEPKLYVQHLADATQCWASHLDACGDLSSLKLWRQAQYLHCASGTHCKNQANQAKTHADEIERGSLLLPPTAPPPTVFVLVPLPPRIGGMQPLLAQHAAVQLGAHALAPAVNLNVAMPPVAPLPLAPVPPPPAGMLGAPMPQLAANMVPQAASEEEEDKEDEEVEEVVELEEGEEGEDEPVAKRARTVGPGAPVQPQQPQLQRQPEPPPQLQLLQPQPQPQPLPQQPPPQPPPQPPQQADAADWTVAEVVAFVRDVVGLREDAASGFEVNLVNGELLKTLTDEDLKTELSLLPLQIRRFRLELGKLAA